MVALSITKDKEIYAFRYDAQDEMRWIIKNVVIP